MSHIVFTTEGKKDRLDFNFNEERECWFEVRIEEINVRVSIAEVKYDGYKFTSPEEATRLSSGIYNSNTEKLLKDCHMLYGIAKYNIQSDRSAGRIFEAVKCFMTSIGWTEVL